MSGLHREWSLNVVPLHVSIKDRTIVGHHVVKTLQYWPHTLVSLIPCQFYYEKGQPCTGSGDTVRVACTYSMISSRTNDVGRWSTMLSGSARPVHVLEDLCEG